MIGTLPDFYTKYFAVFTISIVSSAPYFNPSLSDISIPLKSSFFYPYTTYDQDAVDLVTVTAVTLTNGALPAFITYNQTGLSINPIVISDVNVYKIKVTITDTHSSPSYTFVLTVYNSPLIPPRFAIPVVKQIDIMASNKYNYTLPLIEGIQGEYATHDTTLPRFSKFINNTYSFFPDRASDMGIFIIKGKLWNYYASTRFSFKINVTNEAPFLKANQLQDYIEVEINTIKLVNIP